MGFDNSLEKPQEKKTIEAIAGETTEDFFYKLVNSANESMQTVQGKFNGVTMEVNPDEKLSDVNAKYIKVLEDKESEYQKLRTAESPESKKVELLLKIDEIKNDEYEKILNWFSEFGSLFARTPLGKIKDEILTKFKNKNPDFSVGKGDFSGDYMENKDEMLKDKSAFATHIIQLAIEHINAPGFSDSYSPFSDSFYGYVNEWKKRFGKDAEEIAKLHAELKM